MSHIPQLWLSSGSIPPLAQGYQTGTRDLQVSSCPSAGSDGAPGTWVWGSALGGISGLQSTVLCSSRHLSDSHSSKMNKSVLKSMLTVVALCR